MGKTVALAHPTAQMEIFLTSKGYKVVDISEASRPGAHVDVVLYGADPSESPLLHRLGASNNLTNCTETDDAMDPVGIDVRGMSLSKTAEALELQLSFRHSRR